MNCIVDGLLTQYLDSGNPDAPIVLILHGWGANTQNFDGLARALAGRYRVVRLNLPGFGGTQAPGAAWYVRDYAEFVSHFLAKLGIAQPQAVIGHSFGGRIAIKGLSEGILRPHQAVLLDSAGIRHSATLRSQSYKLVARVGKRVMAAPGLSKFAPVLRRRLYKSAGSEDYLNSGELRQTFINTINEDLSTDAASITTPTLIIWGAEDRDTPATDGRKLAGLIPGAAFSLIAGAGHFVHNDAPDRVASLIEEFLL